MRENSQKEEDNGHRKILFSLARVVNLTLKMESVSQFQESNTCDTQCRAKIKSTRETVLRPDETSFKNANIGLHTL